MKKEKEVTTIVSGLVLLSMTLISATNFYQGDYITAVGVAGLGVLLTMIIERIF
jgi:hypothetical protein